MTVTFYRESQNPCIPLD